MRVFPVGLSFSMLLSTQLIMRRSGLFSQGLQHTATHSDGVTQALTTEPPLSKAQHTARPRFAAGPHIDEASQTTFTMGVNSHADLKTL